MKKLKSIFLLILLSISSLSVYAQVGSIMQVPDKGITLYQAPDANAKALANLSAGQELIPVYQQKDWVKVANPANGDIGWVKQADLQKIMPASKSSVMQNVVITQQNGNTRRVYQIDANGNVQAVKGEQADAVIKQMNMQQQQMQEQFNKMMSNAWQNYLTTQEMFKKFNQEINLEMSNITPSVIVINKADNNAKQDAKAKPAANKAKDDSTPLQKK